MNDGWYGALKEAIQQQQNQLVWVSEGKVRRCPLFRLLSRFPDSGTSPRASGCWFSDGPGFHLRVEGGSRELFLVARHSEILSTTDFPQKTP